ncbi:MAG: glycosyltransferase family 9 protein, partial [Gemmatimonadetes bacterium]|nr:glycosyltransferase family 9 protein [Gemmatimonadota bacterium]
MNVLALQLRRVGDILMTTPALRALKARFPQAEVTYVCDGAYSPVLRAHECVDTLVPYRSGSGLREHLRLVATLRQREFDLALDFESSAVTAMLAAGSGASRRIGFGQRHGYA